MLSPSVIKGLKYTKDENGGNISYLGLNVSTNEFEKGIFEIISEALNKISLNGLSFEKDNDGYISKTNNLRLNFNKLGYLTKLSFNDIDISFYDFK